MGVTVAEPKVRPDRLCAVCSKPLEIKLRAGINPALYVDPFCSTGCCRRYYGVDGTPKLAYSGPKFGA